MVTIIPAILATTEEQFSQELDLIKSSPSLADGWVHIDFMDGELVETKSVDLEVLKKFDIPFKKEAHLMVKRPQEWIDKLVEVKFDRVIIHLEAEEVGNTLNELKQKGLVAGIAVNPETELGLLKLYLEDIDVLQIMDIKPGKQGQPFLSSTYDRVKDAAKIFHTIAVDGGVNDETAAKLVEAGASRLVIGSFLEKGDIEENVEKIWEVIG